MAKFFIKSPLSPLLYMAMLLLGVLGLMMTPRQEDPQISVPMIDLFVQYPGADPDQVASLAVQPLERIMFEIEGVKHVYSASQRGMGIVTIQFEVGEEMESSLVKVNDKLESNMDRIPPGVQAPLVKAKGIDDVPDRHADPVVREGLQRRRHPRRRRLPVATPCPVGPAESSRRYQRPATASSSAAGPSRSAIEVYPERLAGYGLSLAQVAQAITASNLEQTMGGVESGGSHMMVVSGAFLRERRGHQGPPDRHSQRRPVYVLRCRRVSQGPEDANQAVAYYTGAAAEDPNRAVSVPR
jgi:multidrug efflux pump subunit AcrB